MHVPGPLQAGLEVDLPDAAARHVQVLRLQPGAELSLFDGRGGQWHARVLQMGRRSVTVRVEAHEPLERELPQPVTLALSMPANDRMDDLVEKATELGVAAIQPLMSERSVLRLAGERAERKVSHWQGVAAAACEQCGRNRVPAVHPVRTLADWLSTLVDDGATKRLLLSFADDTRPLPQAAGNGPLLLLSGPEGGLSPAEEAVARAHGFAPVTLGPRVLRADTAPLAALAWRALASSAG